MQGDTVVVRAYKDKPFVRRVWDQDERGVWVTTDAIYELLMHHIAVPEPIAGHRYEWIFKYDPATFPHEVQGIPQDDVFWKQLEPYSYRGASPIEEIV